MKEIAFLTEFTIGVETEMVKVRSAQTGKLLYVGNAQGYLEFVDNFLQDFKNPPQNQSSHE